MTECVDKFKSDRTAQELITPKMIEAGVDVYLAHCPDTGMGDRLDRQMVREIFEAMRRLNFESSDIK